MKCRRGGKQKSLAKLRREITILQGGSQQGPAYQLAHDPAVDAPVISRMCQKLRAAIFPVAELEARASKHSGKSEVDEAYFGGRRKGPRGRGAAGKRVVGGLLARDGRVDPKVVEHVSANPRMPPIRAKTRKGAVYDTDAFKSSQSLKRYGKHHTVNQSTHRVDRRTKNPINGIEGFGSFGQHIRYNDRGMPQYHFPMYRKEIECRFHHRRDNLFKLFLQTCFGYVSP